MVPLDMESSMVPGPKPPDLAESGVDACQSLTSSPETAEGFAGDKPTLILIGHSCSPGQGAGMDSPSPHIAGRAAGRRLVAPTILRVETLARSEL
jgi:hypothetical protein